MVICKYITQNLIQIYTDTHQTFIFLEGLTEDYIFLCTYFIIVTGLTAIFYHTPQIKNKFLPKYSR